MPANQPPPKSYQRPDKPKCHTPKNRVREWLKERGLTDATIDAFKIGEQSRGEDVYAVFPYLRDDALVNVKYRNPDRKEDMRQEKGAEPCLFGWHLIDPKARTIVITEGEVDAMTLHQVGIAALSINQGAGNHQWIESDWERLERFSDILVCFDNDEAGDKGAAEVIKRLGMERCRRMRVGAKDANQWLQDGAERVDFDGAVEDAKPLDPDELRSIAEFVNQVKASFYPAEGATRDPRLKLDIEFEWFEFRGGEVTLWTGINGHGKSLLLSQVELGLMQQGSRFAVFSGEMAPARQLKRMVKQASGLDRPSALYIDAIAQWLHGQCWVFNQVGTAKLDRLLEVFTYAHRRYGINHFVIDSLMTTDVPDDGPRANTEQKLAIAKLCGFAKQFNVHVHLVAHPRKGRDESSGPGKMDVAGSGHITNGVDNIFSVWKAKKDEAKPDDDGSMDAKLELMKQRDDGVQNYTLQLWFHKPAMQFRSGFRWRPLSYVDFSQDANQ
jgi:twinkle protein